MSIYNAQQLSQYEDETVWLDSQYLRVAEGTIAAVVLEEYGQDLEIFPFSAAMEFAFRYPDRPVVYVGNYFSLQTYQEWLLAHQIHHDKQAFPGNLFVVQLPLDFADAAHTEKFVFWLARYFGEIAKYKAALPSMTALWMTRDEAVLDESVLEEFPVVVTELFDSDGLIFISPFNVNYSGSWDRDGAVNAFSNLRRLNELNWTVVITTFKTDDPALNERIGAPDWPKWRHGGVFQATKRAKGSYTPRTPRKHKNDRKPIGNGLRLRVMERDGFKCQICGRSKSDGVKLEVDHIHPVSKGGTNDTNNLQTLCFDCNRGKRDRILA